MALVSTGFWAVIALVDNGGNVTRKTYHLRAADFTAATTDTGDILDALAAVTDSVIEGYQIEQRFSNDAFSYPAIGVQNENQALLDIAVADNFNKTATLTIPAPKATLFVGTAGPTANVVDVTDPLILAYVDVFKATGQAYISDGEDADFIKSGRRIHKKNNKG